MKTFFNKKAAALFTILGVAAILISSCKKNDDTYEPIVYGDANIRVVNTVFGSNAQDFYQGDTKLSTAAIAYGEVTPSIKLKAGSSTISVKNAGVITASSNTLLETNANYTYFYYTNASGLGLFGGLLNNDAAPATGKIKIRFLNLGAAFNNTLNIGITGGANVVTGIGFASATDYYSLDPAKDLDVTVLNSGVSAVMSGTNFVAGKIYTVWFDAATSTTAKFHIIVQN